MWSYGERLKFHPRASLADTREYASSGLDLGARVWLGPGHTGLVLSVGEGYCCQPRPLPRTFDAGHLAWCPQW